MKLEELEIRSYTPYSGQPASAIVESRSRNLYPGVRIENISFPLTISAVQCGLTSCLSEGEQPKNVYLSGSALPAGHLDYWRKELNLEIRESGQIDGDPHEIIQQTDNIKNLLKSLLGRALTPHSNSPVSALLETEEGFISGVNIEFGTWESGLCAERTAIAKALASGANMATVRAMHLHTQHGEYCSPCGACRQVIIEHLPRIPVFLHHSNGSVSHHFSSDLLPYSFKSDFLKKSKQQTQNK